MKMQWNDRLKEKREYNKLTLKEVAEKLNTTQPTLISYEQGTVYPKMNVLMDMCDLYGTSINYIIYGNDVGLKLNNTEQKVISSLVGLYLNNNLIFDKDNNSIKFKDKKLAYILKHIIEYIDENDKNDIDTLLNIIMAINKV